MKTLSARDHLTPSARFLAPILGLLICVGTGGAMDMIWSTELATNIHYVPLKVSSYFDSFLIASMSDNGDDPSAFHVHRLNENGEIEWTCDYSQGGGFLYPRAKSTQFDNDGNTYASMVNGDLRSFVIKVNTRGEVEWEFRVADEIESQHQDKAMQIDGEGNISVIVEEYTMNGTIMHIISINPQGELILHETFDFGSGFNPQEMLAFDDLLLVAGSQVPEEMDDSTEVLISVFDREGNQVGGVSLGRTDNVGTFVTNMVISDDNLAFVQYAEWDDMFDYTHYISAFSVPDFEFQWRVQTEIMSFPDPTSEHPARLTVLPDGSIVRSGGIMDDGIDGPLGGLYLEQLRQDDGSSIRQFVHEWDDDVNHHGGAITGTASAEFGGLMAMGIGLTVADSIGAGFGFIPPCDLTMLYFSAEERAVEVATFNDLEWQSLIPEAMCVSPDGFAIVAARKFQIDFNPGGPGNISIVPGMEVYKIQVSEPEPPPALEFPVTELHFGDVEFGGSGLVGMVISNQGGRGRIDSVAFFGDYASEFQVRERLPHSLPGNSVDTLHFIWTPSEYGFANAEVEVYHNDNSLRNPINVYLEGIALAIGDGIQNPPVTFKLESPYPNPFNSATRISFTLARQGVANVSVRDQCGRIVRTLMNSDLNAGSHSIFWSADGVAAGIYMIRLETSGYSSFTKCVVVK